MSRRGHRVTDGDSKSLDTPNECITQSASVQWLLFNSEFRGLAEDCVRSIITELVYKQLLGRCQGYYSLNWWHFSLWLTEERLHNDAELYNINSVIYLLITATICVKRYRNKADLTLSYHFIGVKHWNDKHLKNNKVCISEKLPSFHELMCVYKQHKVRSQMKDSTD